jgi:hypothetical protein
MEFSGDELAGVVDLFGALTHAELGEALAELAFKQGDEYDPEGFESDISAAIEGYHLVELDADVAGTDAPVLVPGPGAFPTLPDGAPDLTHILDVESREFDRATAGEASLDRFREDAATAVESGDPRRVERLVDVSYELEAWADVDLSAERDHLDRVL